MTFNTLDMFIVGAVAISGLLGLYRGFSTSVMSLATWLFALWLPFRFTDEFSEFLPATVESPAARSIIAAGCLFFGAFFLLSFICFLIRKILGATGLGFADRLLGLGLGAVRGIIIVALLAMLATYSNALPKERWWNESRLMPVVLKVSNVIRNKMPSDLSKLFVFNRI